MSHWIKGEDGMVMRAETINSLMIEELDKQKGWVIWAQAPSASSALKTFYVNKGHTLADAEGFLDHIMRECSDGCGWPHTITDCADRPIEAE